MNGIKVNVDSTRVGVEGTKVSADGRAGFRNEIPGAGLNTFEELIFPIYIPTSPPSPSRTLKVTLVWIDLPGRMLQNNLDLIVTDPYNKTERYRNNKGAKDFPFKSTDKYNQEVIAGIAGVYRSELYDRKNNIEQVIWEGVPVEDITVTVRGYNMSSTDGQIFVLAWKVYD